MLSLPRNCGRSLLPSFATSLSRALLGLIMASRDTYNMDDTCEKQVDSSKSSAKRVTQPLRYRTRAFWLLGLYTLLIVVPWVLTCVLAHRPINASSYVRQQGFRDREVANMHNWKIAVDVLNSIAGLITSKQHLQTIVCQLPTLITSTTI